MYQCFKSAIRMRAGGTIIRKSPNVSGRMNRIRISESRHIAHIEAEHIKALLSFFEKHINQSIQNRQMLVAHRKCCR